MSTGNSDQVRPDQQRVLTWFIQAKLRADENRFRQIELGLLDTSTFIPLGNNGVYRLPFFAEFWALRSTEFAEDFREVVERVLSLAGSQIPLPTRSCEGD